MKRSFIVLTTLVLVTVLLSGCNVLPWSRIKVDCTYDTNVFAKGNLPDRLKKGDAVDLFFPFKDKGQYNLESFDIEVKAGDKPVEHLTGEIHDAAHQVIGIFISIPNVGDKPLTVTVQLKESDSGTKAHKNPTAVGFFYVCAPSAASACNQEC